MTEIEILQQRVQILENLINGLVYSDRYIFQKNIQFNEERNIMFGHSLGTQIGTEATQKFAFHGANPVVQAGAITAPSSPGGTYNQAEMVSIKTAVDAIRTVLTNKGLTA